MADINTSGLQYRPAVSWQQTPGIMRESLNRSARAKAQQEQEAAVLEFINTEYKVPNEQAKQLIKASGGNYEAVLEWLGTQKKQAQAQEWQMRKAALSTGDSRAYQGLDPATQNMLYNEVSDETTKRRKAYYDAEQSRLDNENTRSLIDDRQKPDPLEATRVAEADQKMRDAAIDQAATYLASDLDMPQELRDRLGPDGTRLAEQKSEALKLQRNEDILDFKNKQSEMLANVIHANDGVIPPEYEGLPQDVKQSAMGKYNRRKDNTDWFTGFLTEMGRMGNNPDLR